MTSKRCHSGVMDLTPHVETLRHELAVAADAGGEDARALAERLTAPLESAARLVLLDALSAAAAEITRDLAPGSVDLRLRGREPSFVVTPPPAEHPFEEPGPPAPDVPPPPAPEGEEGATARISFRLPEHLKGQVEEAAAQAGLPRDLAPGSVALRLRGREPSFVVTPPPAEHPFEEPGPPAPDVPPPPAPEGEEGATARISFRLPEHLKGQVEEAAAQAGLSVNAWLVRAAAAALESGDAGYRASRRAPRAGQRYTGWVR